MKIKNKDLANVINFLDGVKAKGLKSIHRTRITNKLKSKFEELGEAQKQLQDEFKNDKENYLDEMKKLLDEHVTIDEDRKSTRLNSSHVSISYAVFCLKKKRKKKRKE